MCDALLCDGEEISGVLEVEGTRGKYTAEKIGRFFDAEIDYYRSLSFGILALYAYTPVGRGRARAYLSARDEETIREVVRVSSNHPQKAVIVVALDKLYDRQQAGVRTRSEYYCGQLSMVMAYLYEHGQEMASIRLYGENGAG